MILTLHDLSTFANDNNFIKWSALKAFRLIINKISNASKIAIIFVYLYERCFPLYFSL